MNLKQLAMRAVRAAARLRADYAIGPTGAVCPFDLAEQHGVVVRLVALPSMEGVYSPTPRPTILVSTERPPGRRRYTCAHEFGHHVFGHGTRLDQLADDTAVCTAEEFIAQRFAAALLMPKFAVEAALARRGWPVEALTPERVFIVAQDLGVGYTTLAWHIERTLELVSSAVAQELRRASLPQLRSRLAGFHVEHDLVVADEHWGGRPIDIEVGDIVLFPKVPECTGTCVSLRDQPIPHLRGVSPGLASVALTRAPPPLAIRVARRGFTGLARYRHLEDVVDE